MKFLYLICSCPQFKYGWGQDYKIHTHIIRLVILTLTIHLNKNETAAIIYSNLRANIRLFYDRDKNFLRQGADARQIFIEMVKGNKKLLKFKNKYLSQIARECFIEKLLKTLSNDQENSFITSCLKSLVFLSQSLIHTDHFNLHDILENKWKEIANIDEFSKLKIEYTEQSQKIFMQAPIYYAHIELLKASKEIIKLCQEGKVTQHLEYDQWLPFEDWLHFFTHPHHMLQFEIRQLISQTMALIYYKSERKMRLLHKSDDTQNLLSCLLADIVFFMKYMGNKYNRLSPALENLVPTNLSKDKKPNLFIKNSNFQSVYYTYMNAIDEIDFGDQQLQIGFENVRIEELYTNYIYKGCIDLVFEIILARETHMIEVIDKRHNEIRCMMDFVLKLMGIFVDQEIADVNFKFKKFIDFFRRASQIKEFKGYKQQIFKFNETIAQKHKTRSFTGASFKPTAMGANDSSSLNRNTVDRYYDHLAQLVKNQKVYKENNLKILADHIAGEGNKERVMQVLIKYLDKDLARLDGKEIKFICRLLRKLIQREKSDNLDQPIYLWKEIGIKDLRRIKNIQEEYLRLHLTEILFELMKVDNDEVVFEAIHLGLAYLYGGSENVQEDFYQKLTEDTSNQLMRMLSSKLDKNWSHIKTKEQLRMKTLFRLSYQNLFKYLRNKTPEELEEQRKIINTTQGSKAQRDQYQKISESVQEAVKQDIDPQLFEDSINTFSGKMFVIVLSFLQALCDNQYQKLQQFLRVQQHEDRIFPKNYNFVANLRHIINNYYRYINLYNIKIGNKVMDTIIEVTEGDVKENVADLLNKTFIYDLCRVLTDYNSKFNTIPRGFGLDFYQEDFADFKSNIIMCFRVIFESRIEKNTQVLKKHLDIQGLLRIMGEMMKSYLASKDLTTNLTQTHFINQLKNEDYKTPLGSAVEIYIIFRYIWEGTEEFEEKTSKMINNYKLLDEELDQAIKIQVKKKKQKVNLQSFLKSIWENGLRSKNELQSGGGGSGDQNNANNNGEQDGADDEDEDDDEFEDPNIKKARRKREKLEKDFLYWTLEVFKKIVNSVEIIDESKDPSLIRVWYPTLAYSQYLEPETKHSFMTSVDRSNSQTKISSLFDSFQEFWTQMLSDYESSNKFLNLSPSVFYYLLRIISNILAMVVSIINLASYELQVDKNPFSDKVQSDQSERDVNGLNVAQIAISGILLILWFKIFLKRVISLKWEQYVDKNIKTMGELPTSIEQKIEFDKLDDLTIQDCEKILKQRGPNSDEYRAIMDIPPLYAQIKFTQTNTEIFFILKSASMIWRAMYIGICIGSLFHPLIAVFQIIDIAVKSDTVHQIYHAVSRNWRQFLWTLFLLLFVNLIYSMIGFFFLNEFFVDEDNEKVCNNNLECYLTVLNWGLRNGGGIADAIESKYWSDGQQWPYVWRVVYDLTFFIIIIILLLNLIFGMIIDAFGELRDQKRYNEEDAKNVCFVCGIERSEYERHANFEEHIQNEHNPWAYIHYLVYLKRKYEQNRLEMTYVENKVYEKFTDKDFSWVPIGRSLTFETVKKSVDEQSSIIDNVNKLIKTNQEEAEKRLKEETLVDFKDDLIQELKEEIFGSQSVVSQGAISGLAGGGSHNQSQGRLRGETQTARSRGATEDKKIKPGGSRNRSHQHLDKPKSTHPDDDDGRSFSPRSQTGTQGLETLEANLQQKNFADIEEF